MNIAELSIRQQLIVAWVAMGCNRKQIGSMLKISEKTVDWYMDKIQLQVGFRNVAMLTHYALLAGLVEPLEL